MYGVWAAVYFCWFLCYKLYLLLFISYVFKPGVLAEAHARFLEIAFVREVCLPPRP